MALGAGRRLRLPSGRRLAWAEYGLPAGAPVVHFHGHPGSRLEGQLADAAARRTGVRLISVDRPGMGYSDHDPRRRLLDWPGCVAALADALGIGRFAVAGVSGGAPYALACAYRIPERVTACALVAGLGPLAEYGVRGMTGLNRLQFHMALRASWLLHPLWWLLLARHRGRLDDPADLERWLTRVSRRFVNVTGGPGPARAYAHSLLEAFRQGTRGVVHDSRIYAHPWGFRLRDVAFRPILLWHGEADSHVPVAMARTMAEALPGCSLALFPGQDHFALIFAHLDDVFGALRRERTRPTPAVTGGAVSD